MSKMRIGSAGASVIRSAILMALGWGIVFGVVASSGPREAAAWQQAPDASATPEQKREWLRLRLIAGLNDPTQIAETEARLGRMSPGQVDTLLKIYQHRATKSNPIPAYTPPASSSVIAGPLPQPISQPIVYPYPYSPRPVGYAPIVTWLPSGASMSAGAVVSPDRRYVRINAAPFFSSIGPVETFNFQTGQRYVYYPPQVYPQYPAVWPTPYAPATWDGSHLRR